ncbi:hypothetical protein DFH09DRAFT_1340315 [Mycena vulgaris]|nr:hypothetical protein DFH09DRAFT_1340315 [Mycena vulgaris]
MQLFSVLSPGHEIPQGQATLQQEDPLAPFKTSPRRSSSHAASAAATSRQVANQTLTNLVEDTLKLRFPKFIKPRSQDSPRSEVELQVVHPLPENFKLLAARIRVKPPTYMLGTPPSTASPILWW